MSWHFHEQALEAVRAAFPDIDTVFALQGKLISPSGHSNVIRVEIDGVGYYVKRAHPGSTRWYGLAQWKQYPLRTPVDTERRNLALFRKWGIPVALPLVWGTERRCLRYLRGALVTQEIPGTTDMATLATRGDPRLHDRKWLDPVSRQLADATRTMHAHRFAHNDLKWRNLLVDASGKLFLIDCPAGRFWRGPFLQRRIIKDLACLDKVARHHLSRTRRLRFYLQYCNRSRLLPEDRPRIRRIMDYFKGRE